MAAGAIRAAVVPRETERRGYRDEIAKARDAVKDALLTEPLERGAVEQALAKLRAQSQRGQELTHQAIAEAAARGTLEQRRELAGNSNRQTGEALHPPPLLRPNGSFIVGSVDGEFGSAQPLPPLPPAPPSKSAHTRRGCTQCVLCRL